MFGVRTDNKVKTDREILDLIWSKVKSLDERLSDLEETLGGKEEREEIKSLKTDLKENNKFMQSLLMQLVENSKTVQVAAASKPSAIEAYQMRKAEEAKAITNNGRIKLPG